MAGRDLAEYYGGVNQGGTQYQTMTGKFSQSSTSSVLTPVQGATGNLTGNSFGGAFPAASAQLDIINSYKTPFASHEDMLERLELFVSLDKDKKTETKGISSVTPFLHYSN